MSVIGIVDDERSIASPMSRHFAEGAIVSHRTGQQGAKAVEVGTRATGRSRSYRYYTCFNRARYDGDKRDFTRLDADSVDAAVLEALGKFYRTWHDLISQAITAQQRFQ